MKIEILYTTSCKLTVIDTLHYSWEMPTTFEQVSKAIEMAKDIFNGETIWEPEQIDCIFISDINTGDLLVECRHDIEYDFSDSIEESN